MSALVSLQVNVCVRVCASLSGHGRRQQQPQLLHVQREEIKGRPFTSVSFLGIKKIINNNGLEQCSGQTGEKHERKLIGLLPAVCLCVCVWYFGFLPWGQVGAENHKCGLFFWNRCLNQPSETSCNIHHNNVFISRFGLPDDFLWNVLMCACLLVWAFTSWNNRNKLNCKSCECLLRRTSLCRQLYVLYSLLCESWERERETANVKCLLWIWNYKMHIVCCIFSWVKGTLSTECCKMLAYNNFTANPHYVHMLPTLIWTGGNVYSYRTCCLWRLKHILAFWLFLIPNSTISPPVLICQ